MSQTFCERLKHNIQTHLIIQTVLNLVNIAILFVKIVKHITGNETWKNELFEHLVITLSFEAEFFDMQSNTLHFFTIFLIFYLLLQYLFFNLSFIQCVKSVQIRSFSSPYFPAYGLTTRTLRIQSECGKIRTRKNSVFWHFSRSDTFYNLAHGTEYPTSIFI